MIKLLSRSATASTHIRSTPWPEALLFDGIISRVDSLFTSTMNIVLYLEVCAGPIEGLEAALHDTAGSGLTDFTPAP